MRRTSVALATVTFALAAAAPAAARTHYVVRYGDTLTGIARAHGISLERLARLNHRRPYAILRAGTVLVVPGGRTHRGRAYTVRFGDTLSGIAARFGTSVERLARRNGLAPRGILLAGSTLRVPSSGGPSHHAGGFRGRYRVVPGDTLTGIAAGSASASTGSHAPTACAGTESCWPGSPCACRPMRGSRSRRPWRPGPGR